MGDSEDEKLMKKLVKLWTSKSFGGKGFYFQN